MRCNSKIHVIKDESLGGIDREYVETNRKAKVGEKVLFNGQAYEVINRGTTLLQLSEHIYVGHYGTPVLEPTDILHIDGERYRMVDRKAKVGERVIQSCPYFGNLGKVSDVTRVFDDGSGIVAFNPLEHDEYRVLVPVESEIAAAEPPQSQADIIANLVRRVSQLESELTGAKRDIETWAQEVEGLRYTNEELYSRLGHVEADTEEFDEKVEMIIDDIVTLDERTNLSQEITINVAEFVKLIGGARR